MRHYDLAVIGSGSGLIVMEEALKHGKTVAVIEKAEFGGTCLNRGCIPSKMLVYPADLIREAQRGERVGVTFAAPKVDWEKIARRMRRQTDVNQELERDLEKTPGLTLYKGEAAFEDPRALRVRMKDGGEERLSADDIVIAAGARTRIPDIAGLEDAGYITSESFFGDKFPQKPYDSLLFTAEAPRRVRSRTSSPPSARRSSWPCAARPSCAALTGRSAPLSAGNWGQPGSGCSITPRRSRSGGRTV